MGHDSQKMLTVRELAERWSVAPLTVRRLIASGKLPAYRIQLAKRGRAVRIRLEEIIQYEEFR